MGNDKLSQAQSAIVSSTRRNYLVSDGSNKPHRCAVRDPSFVNLQALAQLCTGHLIADVVAIIGSIDRVMGGVDR